MRLAIEEARKGAGCVSPNPLVGCTIVDREHRFLAVGFHQRVGFDHAEIDAIKKLPDQRALEGATLYVTLEPCAHEGRTPSCAHALVKLPLKAVVYGLQDPNPKVSGQGAQILRAGGIVATEIKGLESLPMRTARELIEDLEDLAEVFFHNMLAQAPFVAIKVATSLDGMMAYDSGESKWISGEESRRYSHRLRAQHDAVVIGRNTFVTDNPKLNIRLEGFENHANKVVIVDPAGKTLTELAESNLLRVRGPENIFVATGEGARVENPAGVKVLEVKTDVGGALHLPSFMAALWERQIMSLFIEGGAQTFSHFLTQGQVHRLHLFIAPHLIGGKHGLSWTRYFGGTQMSERVALKQVRHHSFGPDLYWTARLS